MILQKYNKILNYSRTLFRPSIKGYQVELHFLNGDSYYLPIIYINIYKVHIINNCIINYLINNFDFETEHDFDFNLAGYNNNNPIYIIVDIRHIDQCYQCFKRYNNIKTNKNYIYFKDFSKLCINNKILNIYCFFIFHYHIFQLKLMLKKF